MSIWFIILNVKNRCAIFLYTEYINRVDNILVEKVIFFRDF